MGSGLPQHIGIAYSVSGPTLLYKGVYRSVFYIGFESEWSEYTPIDFLTRKESKMGRRWETEEERKDRQQYTLHGRYNHSTEKPYVEIKKNGEHYCYAPWSCFKEQAERNMEDKIHG